MIDKDGVSKRKGPADRESAWEWFTAHKHPELLPTPWLTDSELEDFTEALLTSERLLGSNTRHVQHVERWGVSGDKQDGIDFFGRFSDGTPAAWQVKQLKKLPRSDVRAAVRALTFKKADELYLVYGGIATRQARGNPRASPMDSFRSANAHGDAAVAPAAKATGHHRAVLGRSGTTTVRNRAWRCTDTLRSVQNDPLVS